MLSVVVAERPEDLLDELAVALAVPTADPFVPELVSDFSLGMTNWVTQQLSLRLGARPSDPGSLRQDGVVANIQMLKPSALRHRVLRAYRGLAGSGSTADAWHRDQLVWSILEVLADDGSIDPALDKLMGNKCGVERAAAIAKLFDRYNRYRPGMVLDWLRGADVDASGQQLSDDHLWQPRLLRTVRDHIDAHRGATPAPPQEVGALLRYLHSGGQLAVEGPNRLPERIFLFGESSLPGGLGPLLQALAVSRDVRLLLLAPSTGLARRVAEQSATLGTGTGSDEALTWAFPRVLTGGSLVTHPLTENWGRSQADLAVLMGGAGVIPEPAGSAASVDPASADQASGSNEPTLLAAIQAGVAADTIQPVGDGRQSGDRSVRIHGAAGPTRQVEILRDQILDLLNNDPDLTEDDIVVICPRLDVYASLISGVWGASAGRGSQPVPDVVPALRYSIVNQSSGELNPLFGALDELLEMVPGRFTQIEVSGILASKPVRRKFDLDDNDFDLIDELAYKARVRWGLSGTQREVWGIDPDYQLNSWEWGIHQLMLGVALGDDLDSAPVPGDPNPRPHDRPTSLGPGGVPPLSLGEGAMAAAGRIAGAIAGLRGVHDLIGDGNERTIEEWVEQLSRSVDLMFEVERSHSWQRHALDSALEALVSSSTGSSGDPSSVRLGFADFRALLAPTLKGQASRASMTHGAILVAPPGVVASVPYKVVCILGLDGDAILPSTNPLDDLTSTSDWIGDVDGRQRARGDLLAAVQAARKHLLITCTSTDVKNNRVVPRAVVLEELLDVIAATLGVSVEEVLQPETGVYVAHTRQAFDPLNFKPGGSTAHGAEGAASYDPTALKAAIAQGDRVSGPLSQQEYLATKLLVDHRLADVAAADGAVELADLVDFFAGPAEVFLKSTLGLTLSKVEESSERELPASLGGLDAYAVGAVLLQAGLRGDPRLGFDPESDDPVQSDVLGLRSILEVEAASGLLPPAAIARVDLARICGEVRDILGRAKPFGVIGATPTSTAIDLRLPSGARLLGNVDHIATDEYAGPVRITYTRPNPKQYLGQVIRLLALAATDPTRPWTALLITRPDGGKRPKITVSSVKGGIPGEVHAAAVGCLDVLVAQYRDGLQCSLPLFVKTSKAKFKGNSVQSAWGSNADRGEAKDRYIEMAFGPMKAGELEEVSIDGFTLESEANRLWGALDAAVDDVTKDVTKKVAAK